MHQIQKLLQKFLLSNFFILACAPVNAQITPDNTLGTEASRLNPNVLINGAPGDKIEGGAVRGSNLFHSFSEFNLDDGERVYFGNPSGVENILTRVTGGNASNIFGTLGVDGTANLFLMNPNGILFGSNARLDVRGSFLGTTANSFVFPNGVFSAKNPQAPPLLTISVPFGLGFGSQPGGITSQGNQLGINDSTLALIGGEIALDNSVLFANNGQVQLGAVGGNTTVGLNVNGSELNFSLAEASRSPIALTRSAVFTDGDSAIKLIGGQINLNNSSLFNQNGGSISFDATGLSLDSNSLIGITTEGATKAGDIQIQVSDAVALANSSKILSNSGDSATGNGGDISINAKAIAITGDGISENSSIISTFTSGQGNGGNLTLNATDSININGGFVSIATDGAGNAGNLTVQAGNAVNVTDTGTLSLFSNGSGSTGDLRIETGTLRIQNADAPGGVAALANRSGRVGSISIQARDAVEVINSLINAQVAVGSAGRAGDITINTQRVNLKDGGNVITSTFSNTNAGNIVIRASESVDISGVSPSNSLQITKVSSATATGATGNSGNITIETPRLTLSQAGAVSATSVQSQGNAGNINIRAKDVELNGFVAVPKEDVPEQFQLSVNGLLFHSELNSQVIGSNADVQGGTITIDTERLRLSNGAQVNTSIVLGRGQGGNLVVRAIDSIDITGTGGKRNDGSFAPSGLFTELQTGGIGSGGTISVETGHLNMSNGGQISASTFNQGNAGDIAIRAAQIDLRGENTFIITTVEREARGNGGNLNIISDRLTLGDGTEVSSSTFGRGNGGNLTVNADQLELFGLAGLFSAVAPGANGNGGKLSVTGNQLIVRDGASVDSSTFGQGQAGDLTVNIEDLVEIVGSSSDGQVSSGIFATTIGSGNAGDLSIRTQRFSVRNGGKVSVATGPDSTGQGGNLTINASDGVEVVGFSMIIDSKAFYPLAAKVRGKPEISPSIPRVSMSKIKV
ncbi:MAG: filamentous hemagglutinin N-terminal domain-containing protein [Richelia sp. RM1_1_1]|nr:filamentous hemagglutinin N-terminal domain-containing protein [Richelia sp. RM1_1_1]